jgi:hypothetical protein
MNNKPSFFNSGTASRKAQGLVNRLHRENPNATDFEIAEAFYLAVSQDENLKGLEYPNGHVTEDWLCIDCGVNTAPGFPDGRTTLQEVEATGGSTITVGADSEVYMVREAVWKKAGMEPFGGCLCIGCLERRLGRKLKPKDFSDHVFNGFPGSKRLLKRRRYYYVGP